MGRIHSIETLGALDGPGLRTVVFLQGCPLRCAYCHNPDTWDAAAGTEYSARQVAEKVKRFKPYFKNGGGLTLSGGEPLAQGDFCCEIIKLCAADGIHTAIDTGGSVLRKDAVTLANLIILDVKHTDPAKYRRLTGAAMEPFLEFLDFCKAISKPLWIRQVIVPGLNDTEEDMAALARLVQGANTQKIELLPYHTAGAEKWKRMGLRYTLDGVDEPSEARLKTLYNAIEV
ncbi:MAG: pyruvate formate lyase-activating protein [Clostridiales bacterium]|jgi:pyruvate formate lyase activating enzyme|nr:pyruvate formate lyase-activating protein [Clostridiales bacterium]